MLWSTDPSSNSMPRLPCSISLYSGLRIHRTLLLVPIWPDCLLGLLLLEPLNFSVLPLTCPSSGARWSVGEAARDPGVGQEWQVSWGQGCGGGGGWIRGRRARVSISVLSAEDMGVLPLHHVTSVPASQGCSIHQEVKRIVLPPSICRPLHFLLLTDWIPN